MMIHIGKKIEEEARRQQCNITELADIVGLSRNVVYNVFGRSSINTELLLKFSFALKHDFFRYYTQAFEGAPENRESNVKNDIRAIHNTLKGLEFSIEKLISDR